MAQQSAWAVTFRNSTLSLANSLTSPLLVRIIKCRFGGHRLGAPLPSTHAHPGSNFLEAMFEENHSAVPCELSGSRGPCPSSPACRGFHHFPDAIGGVAPDPGYNGYMDRESH